MDLQALDAAIRAFSRSEAEANFGDLPLCATLNGQALLIAALCDIRNVLSGAIEAEEARTPLSEETVPWEAPPSWDDGSASAIETKEILADNVLMEQVRAGLKELGQGKGIPLETVVKELGLDDEVNPNEGE